MATCGIIYSHAQDRYYLCHTSEPMEDRLRKHLSAYSGWTARTKDRLVVNTE